MLSEKLLLSAILLLSLRLSVLQAQETLTASGGNASGKGGTVSYTVGQIVYTIIKGTNGSLVQGVQQPYEISVVFGIGIQQEITLQYSVFPNPTIDNLTLKIEGKDIIQCMIYLYNTMGDILQNIKSVTNETIISMGGLPPGIYYLKVYTTVMNDLTGVTQEYKEVKAFKVIKN